MKKKSQLGVMSGREYLDGESDLKATDLPFVDLDGLSEEEIEECISQLNSELHAAIRKEIEEEET